MVVTTFKQNADLYVGATNTAHNPFIFNRPPTLDHLRILFGEDALPDVALQHPLRGRGRRRDHARCWRCRPATAWPG